jgi:hypothetical protein
MYIYSTSLRTSHTIFSTPCTCNAVDPFVVNLHARGARSTKLGDAECLESSCRVRSCHALARTHFLKWCIRLTRSMLGRHTVCFGNVSSSWVSRWESPVCNQAVKRAVNWWAVNGWAPNQVAASQYQSCLLPLRQSRPFFNQSWMMSDENEYNSFTLNSTE